MLCGWHVTRGMVKCFADNGYHRQKNVQEDRRVGQRGRAGVADEERHAGVPGLCEGEGPGWKVTDGSWQVEGSGFCLPQWEKTGKVLFGLAHERFRTINLKKRQNVTEGVVKLWKPKINANKFILFIQDLKSHPQKFLQDTKQGVKKEPQSNTPIVSTIEETVSEMIDEESETITITREIINIENQYQTVKKTKELALKVEGSIEEYQTVKKIKEDNSFSNIEELLKKIVPAKSFLYRHPVKKAEITAYLPMDAGPAKKRKPFRISNYDYPIFDFKRYSKPEGDRGYYPMKRNSRFFIQKSKTHDSRPKYNSISTTEELKYPEDHFYEDLCYNDIDNERSSVSSGQSKPYRVKIQELFQSFKIPFFKKSEEVVEEDREKSKEEKVEERRIVIEDKEPMYENSDSVANMYDSVHVGNQEELVKENDKTKLPVEDYLEPVQLTRDYCDVTYKQKDDSLLGYIMGIFEARFGIRRETSDTQSEELEPEPDTKWTETHHMADRPLPVPVENEPYYMDIDRLEAENLLRGLPDGTFVLRPSSQASHAYTLTVSCACAVHNVGVRRRADGRLALGFARKGERSFADVPSLLRHHKRRRLLLVARGGVLGATTLLESAPYYQTPRSLRPR